MTNEGREIDSFFSSKLFYLVTGMLDPQLKFNCCDTLSFLKNIFDYNPKIFSESQTLALLIRISMIAITATFNG